MRLSSHPFHIACVLAVGVCAAQSAGVALLKDQVYHRDVSGIAVAYTRIIDSGGPYLRLVSGKTNVDIQRSKMVASVEVAEGISTTITQEEDIAPIREILGALKDFTARYPQSRALLNPQITALTTHIRHFDAGKVRFEGLWMSQSELAEILNTRKREYDASERMEVEKRVFDGYQRDKGLVLHDSKWMTPEEVESYPPESATELSESITPLWNGDLEGACNAVNFLSNLASKQTGAPKVRTERLISAVKNLFLAESRLNLRIIASTREAYDASIHDKNANAWLKPNGFGTVHYDAHRDSRERAAEIRQRSADGLAQCKRDLRSHLAETEIVASDFFKLREKRVAMILSAAVSAVSSRHFSEAEFQPSPPPK